MAPEGVACRQGQGGVGPIVIVSGDEGIAELLRLVLEAEGYEVAWVPDLDEADDGVIREQPAVLLIEVSSVAVRGSDNQKLRRAIEWRARHPNAPAILIAAELSYVDRKVARSAFDLVLDKYTLDIDGLLRAVADMLREDDSRSDGASAAQ